MSENRMGRRRHVEFNPQPVYEEPEKVQPETVTGFERMPKHAPLRPDQIKQIYRELGSEDITIPNMPDVIATNRLMQHTLNTFLHGLILAFTSRKQRECNINPFAIDVKTGEVNRGTIFDMSAVEKVRIRRDKKAAAEHDEYRDVPAPTTRFF
jgi:hypothetical protein